MRLPIWKLSPNTLHGMVLGPEFHIGSVNGLSGLSSLELTAAPGGRSTARSRRLSRTRAAQAGSWVSQGLRSWLGIRTTVKTFDSRAVLRMDMGFYVV